MVRYVGTPGTLQGGTLKDKYDKIKKKEGVSPEVEQRKEEKPNVPLNTGPGVLSVGVEGNIKSGGGTFSNRPAGKEAPEQRAEGLGTRFAKRALDLPLGIGTSIKTISRGLSSLLGKGEEHEQFAGETTLKDVGTTALTVGALGVGAGLAGKALGSAGKAVITSSSQLGKKVPLIAQRAFVGKPAKTGVDKIFGVGRKAAASRFATNTKSMKLTGSFLGKIGLGVGAASLGVTLLGTYPFAAFGKEEALQTIAFPMSKAINEGKVEDAQNLLNLSNEIIENSDGIINQIPIKNVYDSFQDYIDAQAEANIVWQNIINDMKGGA